MDRAVRLERQGHDCCAGGPGAGTCRRRRRWPGFLYQPRLSGSELVSRKSTSCLTMPNLKGHPQKGILRGERFYKKVALIKDNLVETRVPGKGFL